MEIAILYNCEEVRIDIIEYSGENDCESIEEFIVDKGYKLGQIDWACSDKIEVNRS